MSTSTLTSAGRSDHTAAIRAFNRFYTARIGALGDGHLHTHYSLTEARVLFELAQHDVTEVVALRRQLGLDASYVSRILARFETAGLVRRERSPADARRQTVVLTDKGRSEFGLLDGRASDDVGRLLDSASESERARLVAAMETIRNVLDAAPAPSPATAAPGAPPASRARNELTLRPLGPGDLGWIVHRNAVVYAEEYGFSPSYEALVARIVADYGDDHDPARETGWVAELDGAAVGAVLCVRKDDVTAQLRLLLVEPSARGRGVGSRLVEECVGFAARTGYRRIVLWTNDVLTAARRVYERAGFELMESAPHHSFGRDLVGQWWGLDLPGPAQAEIPATKATGISAEGEAD